MAAWITQDGGINFRWHQISPVVRNFRQGQPGLLECDYKNSCRHLNKLLEVLQFISVEEDIPLGYTVSFVLWKSALQHRRPGLLFQQKSYSDARQSIHWLIDISCNNKNGLYPTHFNQFENDRTCTGLEVNKKSRHLFSREGTILCTIYLIPESYRIHEKSTFSV